MIYKNQQAHLILIQAFDKLIRRNMMDCTSRIRIMDHLNKEPASFQFYTYYKLCNYVPQHLNQTKLTPRHIYSCLQIHERERERKRRPFFSLSLHLQAPITKLDYQEAHISVQFHHFTVNQEPYKPQSTSSGNKISIISAKKIRSLSFTLSAARAFNTHMQVQKSILRDI